MIKLPVISVSLYFNNFPQKKNIKIMLLCLKIMSMLIAATIAEISVSGQLWVKVTILLDVFDRRITSKVIAFMENFYNF